MAGSVDGLQHLDGRRRFGVDQRLALLFVGVGGAGWPARVVVVRPVAAPAAAAEGAQAARRPADRVPVVEVRQQRHHHERAQHEHGAQVEQRRIRHALDGHVGHHRQRDGQAQRQRARQRRRQEAAPVRGSSQVTQRVQFKWTCCLLVDVTRRLFTLIIKALTILANLT